MKKTVKINTIDDLGNNIIDKAKKIYEWWWLDCTHKKAGETKEAPGLPEGYHSFDQNMLNKLFNMAQPLLREAQVTRRLEVKSKSQIIELVHSGKISIKDGKDMMEFMKAKLDVDEKEINVELQKEIADSIKDDLKGEKEN